MAQIVIPRAYSAGLNPTEAQLDTSFDSVEVFFNLIGLDSTNFVDSAFTEEKIVNGSVTTLLLQNSSVTTAKIADEAITPSLLNDDVLGAGIPIGMEFYWPSNIAPQNYLLCDGSLISRTMYADLFNVIGIDYGQGDGTTTFNLPDHRGLFARGQDDGAGRDPDAASRTALAAGGATGDAVGSYQDQQVESHVHSVSNVSVNASGVTSSSFILGRTDGTAVTNWVSQNAGSETRPVNIYFNVIIKVT